VAARVDAPVLGAQSDYSGPDKWELSVSWRYQRSDRHFVGHDEQEIRAAEHSQVVNRINQADVSITRKYVRGWRFTVGIPYLMAERSNPVRDANGVVIDRSVTQGRGLGDLTLTLRKWLWDPKDKPKGNVSLGFGVKLPTGDNNVVDTRERFSNGALTLTEQTVDQSIQPGDGGFGALFDVQMVRRSAQGRFAAYGGATYLANPEGVSGVRTYRSAPGEELMSIADQYLVRTGLAWYTAGGFGISLGGRAEGVPVYDLLGSSKGFRRPGYAISIEPGVSWTRGAQTFALQIPIAVDRARLRSYADRRNNDHGDAAFADYLVLVGYSRRY